MLSIVLYLFFKSNYSIISVLIYSNSKSFDKTQFCVCILIFQSEKSNHQNMNKISRDFSL